MDARPIVLKIRNRGFTIKAIGNDICMAPKQLLDERMIAFIRKNKQPILTALYLEQDDLKAKHHKKKNALSKGRLEVLMLILRRYLKPGNPFDSKPTESELEEFLDDVLKKHDYDLEDAIATYRNITTPPAQPQLICSTCGYRPLFCECDTFNEEILWIS